MKLQDKGSSSRNAEQSPNPGVPCFGKPVGTAETWHSGPFILWRQNYARPSYFDSARDIYGRGYRRPSPTHLIPFARHTDFRRSTAAAIFRPWRSVTPIAWRRAARWIMTDFTRSEVRAARELKMWPVHAQPKAARCASGRIPADTAPTCCSLTSRVTALHQRVVATIATGV